MRRTRRPLAWDTYSRAYVPLSDDALQAAGWMRVGAWWVIDSRALGALQ